MHLLLSLNSTCPTHGFPRTLPMALTGRETWGGGEELWSVTIGTGGVMWERTLTAVKMSISITYAAQKLLWPLKFLSAGNWAVMLDGLQPADTLVNCQDLWDFKLNIIYIYSYIYESHQLEQTTCGYADFTLRKFSDRVNSSFIMLVPLTNSPRTWPIFYCIQTCY